MEIVLAGNPNSGKTTLFNRLTGSSARVGNWAGVTVEKRSGVYSKAKDVTVTDLPGIYSLSPYSPEEKVAKDYVLGGKPDCIIDVIDATNLERGLYLATQLLETDVPLVIALNMMDAVEKKGDRIIVPQMERIFRVPVVLISASKGLNVDQLMETAAIAARRGRRGFSALSGGSLDALIKTVIGISGGAQNANALFNAVKAIENSPHTPDKVQTKTENAKRDFAAQNGVADYAAEVADGRYKFITAEIGSFYLKSGRAEKRSATDKADALLTGRFTAIPFFALIMFLIFHFTFGTNFLFSGAAFGNLDSEILGKGSLNSPGVIAYRAVKMLTDCAAGGAAALLPDGKWYSSLIVDGLLNGVGTVLTFLPQILCLFFCFSLLEDTGYMARIAFITDKLFQKLGMTGRALIPLITCFGCAVPGIMATRTLSSEKERRITLLLTPFMSCGAKLPVWLAFGACMFGGAYSDLIVYSMYLLGIAVAILSAFILNKTVFKGESAPFVMELPSYRLPTLSNTLKRLWDKAKHYLIKTATLITASAIIIWFLLNFGFDLRKGTVSAEQSILSGIGKIAVPLFRPLGFGLGENGWIFVVSAFTGFIAKEMIISTLGVFSGMGGGTPLSGESGLYAAINGMDGGAPAAFAFMAFNLLSMPCAAAVSAAAAELGEGKQTAFAIFFWFAAAYSVSALIFVAGAFPLPVCAAAALVFCIAVPVNFNSRKIKTVRRKKYGG